MAELSNGWIDVKDRLPPRDMACEDWTEEVLVLVESPDSHTLWRDIYVGYQEVYIDDDGRETRTWYTYMDGNCARVGQCCVHHYPNGKGYTMKNGARVIAWQPMPNFPDEFPHHEFSKGALCPGDDD